MKLGLLFLILLHLAQPGVLRALDKPGKVEQLRQLTRLVIEEDTTWSGEQLIEGIVVVKKGATLTIAPGTKVSFSRTDIDNDGIGEGELIVEGSLNAKGTKAEPILFTSAAVAPRKRDWKFIMINFSQGSTLEYCIIEYAFSAVQVHFSSCTIKNCILRNNEDGLRFSTARLELSHNEIYQNIYGLRYEERGSKAEVSYNVIRQNDYGIFCVFKSENLTLFEHNNVYDNHKYNLLLGNQQQADLGLPHNYWGSKDPNQVMEKIFAKNYEPFLGKVTILPLSQSPIPQAGLE